MPICHDCNKETEAHLYKVKFDDKEKLFYKCDECFGKDKTLRDFRTCEVFSRVCGYLRPIDNWNLGKISEFHQRTPYQFD